MSQPRQWEWTDAKARWYWRAVRHNNYPLELLKVILPLLKDCSSLVDVGAGCGAFALPLARLLPQVTALEPARAMAALLRREMERQKLGSLHLVETTYQESDIAPHDAVLCAFVPEVFEELEGFASWAEKMAKRRVILVRDARPEEDRLFLKELRCLLFGQKPASPNSYLDTLAWLQQRGVLANVQIVGFRLDQPFDHMEEAVAFWREYLGIGDGRFDDRLRAFLKEKLVEAEGLLIAPVRHLSAVIWWERR